MWGGVYTKVCCPPPSELDSMELFAVLRIAPKLLCDEDARAPATEHLSSRLLSGALDDGETRSVLRVLCAHSPSGTLLEFFLQLLQTLNSPVPVIESMSSAAVSATPSQLQPILDRYRELSNLDRKLLVPIIGSIAELQLSADQKRSYETIVKGALKYVDEYDVPTVVQSLLSLACPSNSLGIVTALREQASALPFQSVILLVEPVVAALRSSPHLAKAFWSDLSRPGQRPISGTITQLDVLVIGQILQVWSLRHDAANALLEAAEKDATALSTIERALRAGVEDHSSASSKFGRAEAPHSTVSAFVRLAMQLALIPSSPGRSNVAFGKRRLEQRSTKLTSGLVSTMSRASFSHKGLRSHTITVLLSACAHKEEGAPTGSGGVGMCAWLAARTVVELAALEGDEREGCAHLVLHFLTQHGPSCDVAVMQLLSSAVVTMYDRETRGMQDLLLLLQKLLSSAQPEHQRAGLILSRHVFRAKYANDRDMVMRAIGRMNFSPAWPHAEHLYKAVMHAAASLSKDSLGMILEHHIRPAAFCGGSDSCLLKIDEQDSSEYIVNILKYIKSKPVSKLKASRGCSELLRCLIHLEGTGGNLVLYAEKACNWFVEMPEDLQVMMPEDLKVPDRLDLDSLSWAMRMGDCCWLNWLIGVAFADTYASCGTSKSPLPLVVRNRMSQAMRFVKIFFEVLKPLLQRFLKSPSRDTFESVGGLALQELVSLSPRLVEAPLRLISKTLAASGSIPAGNTTGPRTRYLPPLQQMLELVEKELEAAFGDEEAQAERDSAGHLDDCSATKISAHERVIMCSRELIDSGLLTWLGFQAKVCIDEACSERAMEKQNDSEGKDVYEEIGDPKKTPHWKDWLRFAKGVYSVLMRVVKKLNSPSSCDPELWREAANSILKGTRRKTKKSGPGVMSAECDIFDELEGYGKKIADGGVAALHLGLMKALLWHSEKRVAVGKLAIDMSHLIFPCDDVVPIAMLPITCLESGDMRSSKELSRKLNTSSGKFLKYLVATAIECVPSEKYSFAESVIDCLARENRACSSKNSGSSSSSSNNFAMASPDTSVHFLDPCIDMALSSITCLVPAPGSLSAGKAYVDEVRRGVKFSVRILRAANQGPGGISLLSEVASQKHVARFASRLARSLKKVVPGVAKFCANTSEDKNAVDTNEDLHALLRDCSEFAESFKTLSTLLGTGGKFDKEAGTYRLDADLLLASLQTCATTQLTSLKPNAVNADDSESASSSDGDDGGASRFYVHRSKGGKRKRDAADGQGDTTSSESGDDGETDTDADEPIVINFKKKQAGVDVA